VPNAFLGPAGNAASRCRPAVNTTQYPGAAFANDCSGQQMVATPKWTVNLGIQQVLPLSNGGSFVAELNTRWEDEREVSASYFTYSRIEDNMRTDASLTYNAPNDGWSLTAYIRNIENKAVVESLTTALNQSGMIGANLRPPRQYGVRFRVRFGE
jgi:iron complex outermembrane receptor protein